MVPKLHLFSLGTAGQRQYLVAEANTKQREPLALILGQG